MYNPTKSISHFKINNKIRTNFDPPSTPLFCGFKKVLSTCSASPSLLHFEVAQFWLIAKIHTKIVRLHKKIIAKEMASLYSCHQFFFFFREVYNKTYIKTFPVH